MCVCVYTHTHTHISMTPLYYTCMYTHMHIYIHAYIHIYAGPGTFQCFDQMSKEKWAAHCRNVLKNKQVPYALCLMPYALWLFAVATSSRLLQYVTLGFQISNCRY